MHQPMMMESSSSSIGSFDGDDFGRRERPSSSSSHPSRKKSYLRNPKEKQVAQRDRQSNVKDSLMKFLNECDTEDLLMGAVVTERKNKSNPLSMSEHTGVGELFSPKGKKQSVSSGSGIGSDNASIRRNPQRTTSMSMSGSRGGNGGRVAPASTSSLLIATNTPSMSSEHGTSPSKATKRIESSSMSSKTGKKSSSRRQQQSEIEDENLDDSDQGSFALNDDSENDGDGDDSDSSTPPPSPASTPRQRHRKRHSNNDDRDSIIKRNEMRRSQSDRSQSDRSASYNVRRSPSTRTRKTAASPSTSTSTSPRNANTLRTNSEGALDRKLSRKSSSRRRNGHDDSVSVGSSRSLYSSLSRRGSTPGLDAGPLNAFLNNPHLDQSTRSRGGGSVASSPAMLGGGDVAADNSTTNPPPDEEFLKRRKSRQDEILNEAMKERWRLEGKKTGRMNRRDSKNMFEDDDDNEGSNMFTMSDGNSDDDQPRVKQKSKNPLKKLQRGLSRTTNAVKNPGRTAKNFGGFAKDVGKETMKLASNPKEAAKAAGSLGKKSIGTTLKVTKNVTTGVAKGGVGLTKTVAKTGFKATTKAAGTVVDGAGKVVKGANGLIFKGEKELHEEQYRDYDAKRLASRRKDSVSLLDRLSADAVEKDDDDDDSVVAVKPTPTTTSADLSKAPSKRHMSNSLAATSMLIPVTSSGKSGSSWDV